MEDVIEATTAWAVNKTAAEPNGKTGKYLPTEVQRNYVWDTDPDFAEYKGLMTHTAPKGPRQYTARLMTNWHSTHA